MCLLSRHNHYRRYFSRPPEANSLSTKRRGIFLSFRPGYFGPGPLALVSFPAGAFRPGHYAPAPSAPRDRHPRPPAWQGPARVARRHRGSMARLSRGWRRGRAGGTDAGGTGGKAGPVRAPPRPRSIGGRRARRHGTQHLPLPAKTARHAAETQPGGPFRSCRAMYQGVSPRDLPSAAPVNTASAVMSERARGVDTVAPSRLVQMSTWHCHIPCPASPARGSVRRSYAGSVSRGRLAGLRPWRDRARRSRTGVPCL